MPDNDDVTFGNNCTVSLGNARSRCNVWWRILYSTKFKRKVSGMPDDVDVTFGENCTFKFRECQINMSRLVKNVCCIPQNRDWQSRHESITRSRFRERIGFIETSVNVRIDKSLWTIVYTILDRKFYEKEDPRKSSFKQIVLHVKFYLKQLYKQLLYCKMSRYQR